MACYHFRIKTDKKPDGTSTAGAEHAEYIDREGKYKDIDEKRLQAYGNDLIAGEILLDDFSGVQGNMLLYTSPYGDIMLTANGLHTTEGASEQTVGIAMMLAEKIFDGKISVEGSTNFKAKAIVASADYNLKISFNDATFQNEFERICEVNNERRNNTRNAIRADISYKPFGKEREIYEQGPSTDSQKTLAKERNGLYKLSGSRLDVNGGRTDLLVSGDEAHNIYEQGRKASEDLRWTISCDRATRDARVTVNEIIDNIKSGRQNTAAASHAQYINREAAFKKRGGCIATGHYLPPWAEDNPRKFFEAADKYERSNGTRYKEIEFSLPNELNLEQQKEIIDRFLENHLKDFYYAYAVHDKIGAMSNGQRHPHVHIMFSERKIDDRERVNPREPEVFFSTPDKRKPIEKRGCGKDKKWNGPKRNAYTCLMREDFAKIQNETLEKYGFDVRVDHRTLKAQREDALASGNLHLAKLLDRLPEPALTLADIMKENNPKVVQLMEYRKLRAERINKLNQNELAKKSLNDTALLHSEITINEKNDVIEKLPTNIFSFTAIKEKKDEILNLKKELEFLKPLVLTLPDAMDEARSFFLTPRENEIWHTIKENRDRIHNLKEFGKNYKLPASATPDEKAAFTEAKKEIDNEIKKLHTHILEDSLLLKAKFNELSTDAYRSKIQSKAIELLNENKSTYDKYIHISQKLFTAMDELSNKANDIIAQQDAQGEPIKKSAADILTPAEKKIAEKIILDATKDQNEPHLGIMYSLNDISKILKTHLAMQQAELRDLYKQYKELSNKVLSPERALYIAKNVYTKQGIKNLNEKMRAYNKRVEAYKAKGVYNQEEVMALNKLNAELTAEKDRLDKMCSSPAAVASIKEIQAGILRKNEPVVKQFNEIKNKIETTKAAVGDTRKRLAAIENKPRAQKYGIQIKNRPQKITSEGTGGRSGSGYSSMAFNHANRIADFVAGSSVPGANVVNLNVRDNKFDEWEWLDEFEKEELLNSISR